MTEAKLPKQPAEYHRQWRANLSPEQRAARAEYDRQRYLQRKAELSPEQRAARLDRERERHRAANLSPKRKAARAERARQRAANLSLEQKAAWTKYHRQWVASLLPEQRAERLERERERGRAIRLSLTDCYVASTLGLSTKQVPSELLELKREQLTLARLSRELKRQLKETDCDSTRQQDAGQLGQLASCDDHR